MTVMCKCAVPILLVFLIFPVHWSFAKTDSRTLIYYFKNITGDEEYVDLTYKIPLAIHSSLKQMGEKSKLILVDEEGFTLYRQDRSTDLWQSSVLLKIGGKSGIDRVLFGSFFVQEGKPVLYGKMFYVRNGLILDVSKEDREIYTALKAVENIDVEQLLDKQVSKKIREYRPPFGRILESGTIQARSVISTCVGSVYPLGDWADLYPPGIISEISILHFPKMNRFPAGLGLNTNYVILRRRASSGFIDSDVKILSVGGAFHYIYRMRRIVQGVTFEVNAGLAISNLDITGESWSSVDPYIKIGVSAMAKPFNIWDMTFKMGIFSIDYKERPVDSLYTEIGILVF